MFVLKSSLKSFLSVGKLEAFTTDIGFISATTAVELALATQKKIEEIKVKKKKYEMVFIQAP